MRFVTICGKFLLCIVLCSALSVSARAQTLPPDSFLTDLERQEGFIDRAPLRSTFMEQDEDLSLGELLPNPNLPALKKPVKAQEKSEEILRLVPKKKIEEDPFVPLGIRVSMFNIRPYAIVRGGYESNPAQVSHDARGSALLNTDVGFSFNSLWSSHELFGAVRYAHTHYLRMPELDDRQGDAHIDLRLDLTKEIAFDAQLRGDLSSQSPNSPEVGEATTSRSLITTAGGKTGFSGKQARWRWGIHALIDHTFYEDAELPDGSILALSQQDYTSYGVEGRLGYEVNPGMIPFIEINLDTRKHDDPVDLSGYARDSNGQSAKVGAELELTHLVKGTVDVGYATRNYEDPRLDRLKGPLFNMSLEWQVTPLTRIEGQATTYMSESNIAGASGYFDRGFSLTLRHALSRRLTLGLTAGLNLIDYQGIDLKERLYKGSFFVNYTLSRYVVLEGRLGHMRRHSSDIGGNYHTETIMAGIKVQR